MGAPDVVVAGCVCSAEGFSPSCIVGCVDCAAVGEVAGECDADGAVGVELRCVPFEPAGEGREGEGAERARAACEIEDVEDVVLGGGEGGECDLERAA